MKPTYLLLALCCVPIVAAAQVCLNWRPVDIQDVDRSRDGRVFGAVAPLGYRFYQRDRREIREWSADLSDCKTIYRGNSDFDNIAVNKSGTVVAFQSHDMVTAIDAVSGKFIWQAAHNNLPSRADLFFTADDRYLVIVGGYWGKNQMNVLSGKDGKAIGAHQATGITRVYSSGDYLTMTDSRDKDIAFLVVDGVLTQVDNMDVPNKRDFERHIVKTPSSNDRRPFSSVSDRQAGIRLSQREFTRPATIEIVKPGSGKVLHRYQPALAERTVRVIRLAVSLSMIAWLFFLVRDGRASQWSWRVLVDLAVVVALMLAVCLRFSDASDDHFGRIKALEISLTVFCCLLFWALFYNRRRFYALVAVFFACAVTPAAPCIFFGLVLRACGYGIRWNDVTVCGPQSPADVQRAQSGARFRFGISEMLILTLFAAVFIGIGVHFLVVIGYGVAITLFLAMGMALSVNRLLAQLVCFFCLLLIVQIACRWTAAFTMTIFIPLLMIPFVFAFLGSYGFRIRRLPRTEAATSAVELPA